MRPSPRSRAHSGLAGRHAASGHESGGLAALARRAAAVVAAAVLPAVAVVPGTPAGAANADLPVFAVRRVGLDPSQSADLQRAFGLDRVDRGADGSVQFLDETAFAFVPTID